VGGEPSLVKTYLNDPLGLEAAVPRLSEERARREWSISHPTEPSSVTGEQ
jgi:hypothetical protein